jgi:2-polyprenyl-3-methyl-5-hydroxy-6-metoxy-1,4-benzoquinol methylase
MDALDELSDLFESIPDTPMAMYFKVVHLASLNMRYEKLAFNRKLEQHPYLLVRDIIRDQSASFKWSIEMLFTEKRNQTSKPEVPKLMEEKHHSLFNVIWPQYDKDSFRNYINRYKHRIEVNHLTDIIKGKRCLDLGCGNGNFCFALVEMGAEFAAGIDFGQESIVFANDFKINHPCGHRCEFKVNSVYQVDYPNEHFDFIVQNGVFHHLDKENDAIKEAVRLLKPGGYFWYYTDGEGGIGYDLWDRSVHLLRNVPVHFMNEIFRSMNMSDDKLVHLLDGMKATYRHTSWKEITTRLSTFGLGNFKRLTGGFETDFDLDVIEKDPYGKEKFGEGDLRILAQLLK